jgi:hypothetical protein
MDYQTVQTVWKVKNDFKEKGLDELGTLETTSQTCDSSDLKYPPTELGVRRRRGKSHDALLWGKRANYCSGNVLKSLRLTVIRSQHDPDLYVNHR